MKINVDNYELFKKVQNITCNKIENYGVIWKNKEELEGYVDSDGLLLMIEELIWEVDRLNDEIKQVNQEFEDYRNGIY